MISNLDSPAKGEQIEHDCQINRLQRQRKLSSAFDQERGDVLC